MLLEEGTIQRFFVLVQDNEHRVPLEENYIFVPDLSLDRYIGIWESWNEKLQEFEVNFIAAWILLQK